MAISSFDCGYTAPDGSDRPAFTEYASIGEWFMRGRRDKPVESVEADPEGEYSNWCRIFFGEGTFNKFARDRAALNDGQPLADDRVPGIGIRAAKRAYESGGLFEFVTKGTGTTSENTPLVLCGDAVYTGKGPLKYLDAEFNFVRFRARICSPKRAGNAPGRAVHGGSRCGQSGGSQMAGRGNVWMCGCAVRQRSAAAERRCTVSGGRCRVRNGRD